MIKIRIRYTFFLYMCFCLIGFGQSYKIVNTELVWSEKHSAFTTMIKYDDHYFLAFRVASSHRILKNKTSSFGYIRVLKSKDMKKWFPIDSIAGNGDMRDPFFSIHPNNRLYLTIPMVQYSKDFSIQGIEVQKREYNDFLSSFVSDNYLISNAHIWKYVWYSNRAYGFSFKIGENPILQTSVDGIEWSEVCKLNINTSLVPTEISTVFDAKGTMYAAIRNNAGKGLIGYAPFPYTRWYYRNMKNWIGSPDFIRSDEDRVYLTFRRYGTRTSTTDFVFSEFDLNKMQITNSRIILQNSNYDIGYGSGFIDSNNIYISFYSMSPDGTGGIYLSKIIIEGYDTE